MMGIATDITIEGSLTEIDDEWRREVADRLRYAATHSERAGVPDDEVLSILSVGTGDAEGYSDPEDVYRLADLIDR